ncbi:ABC transporter ATP-binding protein [Rhodonellum psychrophilum GCM71 = DSM 17998]|uniref:ABC transporter ATP-binding protein n=2 Tax=Rhodonellum TaxID=336827 RepID=U5BVB5_9BACT|nr:MULTISPECIES: ABC transporter ATP-binding protein [Rhodonellum]ERM81813.1 ABC transporter ATP-binding protein [Rhodonellum psychrophilum GCM71 = DSM 17998]MDO9552844.1 ABC transporter ATP-binding protein [Rhodonellum sp.]SDZ27917.1 lipoprotein-releasing system ATP-binding protein [Rhodonellum ikkaensis]
MLSAKGIHKNYGDLHVLKGVDVTIQSGEVVSIVGASGAGKSTLLHILGTLDQADEGDVEVGGALISKLKGDKLAEFRNKEIGFIFQFHNLLPEFTAEENIMIPGLIAGTPEKKLKERAKELAELLGFGSRLDHKPSQLSGGEQQRVAVARALINDPKIIFADEPSGNLDSHNAQSLHELFFELRKKFGQSFVIVTHNQDLAQMADRMLTMHDGKILSEVRNPKLPSQ